MVEVLAWMVSLQLKPTPSSPSTTSATTKRSFSVTRPLAWPGWESTFTPKLEMLGLGGLALEAM